MAFFASGQHTAGSGPGIEPAADLGAGAGVAETIEDGQSLALTPNPRAAAGGTLSRDWDSYARGDGKVVWASIC
jgi:hypothetical protein